MGPTFQVITVVDEMPSMTWRGSRPGCYRSWILPFCARNRGQRSVWNQRTILGRARKSEMLWLTAPSWIRRAWPWWARMVCRQCWALTWVTVVSPLAAYSRTGLRGVHLVHVLL